MHGCPREDSRASPPGRVLTLLEKQAVVCAHRTGLVRNQALAERYGVSHTAISNIIKAQDDIMAVHPLVAGASMASFSNNSMTGGAELGLLLSMASFATAHVSHIPPAAKPWPFETVPSRCVVRQRRGLLLCRLGAYCLCRGCSLPLEDLWKLFNALATWKEGPMNTKR